MTVSSGFFNSVNHDRLYDAEQLSSIFDGVIVDGVYENVGEAFNVIAYPDAYNTVLVGTGRAWFDHTWTLNDSRFSITLDPPNEMLGRIDAIVIDVNKERDTRKNSIIYLKGDEATPDFPPTLIDTENHHQYPIAYITRHAEQNGPIKQSDIEITVGTGACPIATGVLEAQNLENLMQQLDSEFNEWWDGIKEVLDENAATNLQNQIDEINAKLDSDTALVGLLEKPIAEAFMSGDYGLDVTSYSANMPRWYQEVQPTVSFLPNGEMVIIYIEYSTKNYQYNLHINIIGTDGVANEQSYIVPYDSMRGANQSSYSANSGYTLVNFDVSLYPSKFVFLLHCNWGYDRTFLDSILTIQISSSATISLNYSPTTTTSVELSNVQKPLSTYCANAVKLSNGSVIVPNIYYGSWESSVSHRSYEGSMIISLLTEDGTISQQRVQVIDCPEAPGYTFLNNIKMYSVYHLIDDQIISYLQSGSGSISYEDEGARFLINPETLDLTSVYNKATEYPVPERFNYTVYCGTETYSLSESGGVLQSKIEAGGPPDVSSSKKSPYFIGASNLGDPMPEGTLIAANDGEGRLYGIASGGEQIAIGTNGGAAILKTKKSVNTSIDISKSVLWMVGYLIKDDGTYYLMTDANTNRTYSYDESGMGSANTKASVVKISKGV